MKTKRTVKAVGLLFLFLVLIYLGYQGYMMANPIYKTEIAVIANIADSITVRGIAVRDEQVIDAQAAGIKNYLYDDGDKVAVDAVVAQIYSSVETAQNDLHLRILEKELALLKAASEYGRTAGTNLTSISSNINEQLGDLSAHLAGGDCSSLPATRGEVIELLNSFYLTAGQDPDFALRIEQLEGEIASVRAAGYEPAASSATSVGGYFVSSVDGYEAVLNTEVLETIAVEELESIIEDATDVQQDPSCSKVIADYVWSIAFVVPREQADFFREGARISIDFSYTVTDELPVTVKSVRYSEDGEKAVVVLECDRLNNSLAGVRVEEITVYFHNYDGVKIDRNVLRLEDGVLGVYVKSGTTVAFKPITVLYETDTFVVAQAETSDSEGLQLYDEIIVEGKELFVGKELGQG